MIVKMIDSVLWYCFLLTVCMKRLTLLHLRSHLGNNVFVEILVSVDAVCHHCHDVYSAKIYVTSLNIRFCVKFD